MDQQVGGRGQPAVVRLRRPRLAGLWTVGALALAACGAFPRGPDPGVAPDAAPQQASLALYERARSERVDYLEREVARLRADLREAEEAMVAIESGLRGVHTRADAVSLLAESRIAVERAARSAPWRPERIAEARARLEEAEHQFQAGHPGSAVFFATRARRIADGLNEEARTVGRLSSTRFVHGRRVNLRAGPSTVEPVLDVLGESTPVFPERHDGDWVLVHTLSGQVGWIHGSLLRER